MITRSKEGNEELKVRLEEVGLKVVALETMRFLPPEDWSTVDASLSDLSSFDWLVITSPDGGRPLPREDEGALSGCPLGR